MRELQTNRLEELIQGKYHPKNETLEDTKQNQFQAHPHMTIASFNTTQVHFLTCLWTSGHLMVPYKNLHFV